MQNTIEIISNNLAQTLNEEIEYKKNKLECICINTNSKEEDQFNQFINQLVNKSNKEISKNIDFIVVTNNEKFKPNIEELKNVFNDAKTINLELEPEIDIYIPFTMEKEYIENKNYIPDYGIKSGPNISFFRSMKLLKNYNTSMLLETDCILASDWLEKINNYVNYSNGFWISGALYDGTNYSVDKTMLTHLNGVALYATGNKNFQIFLEHFEEYFLESVRESPNLAYDWGLRCFIDENIKDQKNHFFWKFINRNCVANKLIFNFSLDKDKHLEEEKLMKLYNYAILHKKSSLE